MLPQQQVTAAVAVPGAGATPVDPRARGGPSGARHSFRTSAGGRRLRRRVQVQLDQPVEGVPDAVEPVVDAVDPVVDPVLESGQAFLGRL